MLRQGPFTLAILKGGLYHPKGRDKPGEKLGVQLKGDRGIFPKTYLDRWSKGHQSWHSQAFSAMVDGSCHNSDRRQAAASAARAHEPPGDCYSFLLKFPSCTVIPHGPVFPILQGLAQVLLPAESLPSFMLPGDISLCSKFLWSMLLLQPMQHLHQTQ